MIPIMLDPARVRIGLAGGGPLTLRRLCWLREGGANPTVFAASPIAPLAAEAGGMLRMRLPEADDLAGLDVLWIADLEPAAAADLYNAARRARVLVNVEDDLPHLQFHTPALIRRGALTLAISTAGASPAAAGFVRAKLEAAFPEAWGPALTELATARADLRARGANAAAIKADAHERLARWGLLDPQSPKDG